MTRFRFDQFSKQYLEELLSPLGKVTIGKELLGEARQIDVWFVPNSQAVAPNALGLLGRLSKSPCLLEAYRNPPKLPEIRDCLLKLLLTQAEDQRNAKRTKRLLSEDNLPKLWVIASSISENLLSGFSATTDEVHWGTGVYFLPQHLHTGIIAINQLPVNPDTLWLRLLGKGKTQAEAIAELMALSKENSLRSRAIELLAHWRITIGINERVDREAQELIMQLSPAYVEWRDKTLQEGRQEGRQEGAQQDRRVTLEVLLTNRFGKLDSQIEGMIDAIAKLPAPDYAQFLLQFSGLSHEELLQQFGSQ